MDENAEMAPITVRDLMPYIEPEGLPHIKLAVRNMENAHLRAEIERLRVLAGPATDEELHALLGDARTANGAPDA